MSEEKPKRRPPRPFLILAAIAVLVGLGLGAYALLTAGRESTDDAQIYADMVPIAPRVAGTIVEVPIAENQQVKAGDLLARIDDSDLAAKLVQAEADLTMAHAQSDAADAQVRVVEATTKGGLASAKAMLSGSSMGVSNAAAQVEAARAALVRAETDARRTETDLRRAKELRAANAIPQERLDNAQSAHDASQAALAQAKAQLAAAEEGKRVAEARVGEAEGRVTQSGATEPQIAAARAQAEIARARVKAAEAAVSLAKLQVSYARIVAPQDGVASRLSVHAGQLVQVGQPIVQLVPQATYVLANFKETQLGHMKPGQPAHVKIDAFPGRELDARVESLAGGTGSAFSLLPADNATGNFVKVVQRVPVRLAWTVKPPAEVALRMGLSAEVTVEVDR